jgi:MFS family permease
MASVNTASGHDDASRGYRIEILLISFAGLLLEIAYTRVISFKLFYYYTYLVIGLALLGIGTGGVLVAISGRLRRASTDAIMMWGLLLGAVSVGVGYIVVAVVRTDTVAIWDYGTWDSFVNVAGLLAICLALFGSFVAIGVMIATLFARKSEQIGRLYFADLLGAGIACAVVVSLLNSIGPPATIVLAGLILAVTGMRIAWRRRSRVLWAGAVAAGLLAVAVVQPRLLPAQRTDSLKADLGDSGKWSALFRVDVLDVGNDQKLLYHDGLVGSAIHRWDGNPASLGRFDSDPRSFPFTARGAPPGKVMIIGAAGGNEVLASLHFDANHIDAIELNPVTYGLVTDDYAAYTGHLAESPKVNYVQGDGRSYLARSDGKYDLIWYPAPDSYSAANAATSSAYVLSESYLYTSDAIVDSLKHLVPGGIVATQYGEFNYEARPNRTTRYVATARHALAELGIKDPSRHIIVVTSTTDAPSAVSTILVKRDAFTPAEVDRLTSSLNAVPGGTLRYAPGHPVAGNSVTAVATLPSNKLDHWFNSYPYDVRPISDDAPFFWHFTPFGDTISDIGHPIDRSDFEVIIGERVLLLLLAVATLFAAVFLLLPFVAVRNIWSALPRKGRSALYFASLGLGFMFFEVTLIQRLVLFLGYPTYSLTVTLASILIFTGVGALLSERYKQRPSLVVPILLAAITGLTVFYLWGLPAVTDALLGWPLGARMLLAFVVLAPLGVCLGAFMPLGLGAVARLTPYDRHYVAWGWAVNGFASVVGAVLTTILAMTFGFRVVLVLALAVYVVAVIALRGLLRARPAEHPPPAEETVAVERDTSVVGAASPAPS